MPETKADHQTGIHRFLFGKNWVYNKRYIRKVYSNRKTFPCDIFYSVDSVKCSVWREGGSTLGCHAAADGGGDGGGICYLRIAGDE